MTVGIKAFDPWCHAERVTFFLNGVLASTTRVSGVIFLSLLQRLSASASRHQRLSISGGRSTWWCWRRWLEFWWRVAAVDLLHLSCSTQGASGFLQSSLSRMYCQLSRRRQTSSGGVGWRLVAMDCSHRNSGVGDR